MKDFPTLRGVLKVKNYTELAAQERGQVDKIAPAYSAQQAGNFQELQMLLHPGWQCSPEVTHCDTQPEAPSSWQAPVHTPAAPAITPGQSEGGPTSSSYRGVTQRFLPVCSAHWTWQWRQALQLGSRKKLFPTSRCQCYLPATTAITPGA